MLQKYRRKVFIKKTSKSDVKASFAERQVKTSTNYQYDIDSFLVLRASGNDNHVPFWIGGSLKTHEHKENCT